MFLHKILPSREQKAKYEILEKVKYNIMYSLNGQTYTFLLSLLLGKDKKGQGKLLSSE